jgi:hypothetical protein
MATTRNRPRVEQTDRDRTGKRAQRPKARMPHDITIEDRQKAVTAMLTTNRDHPLSARSIAAARDAIGIPVHHETLRTWLKEYRSIVEATLVTKPVEQIIQEHTTTHYRGWPLPENWP